MTNCGDKVDGGAGKVSPVESGQSGQSEAGEQRDVGQHVHQRLGWTEEGEKSCGEKQHVQDGVLPKGVEDAATQQTWLLVKPFLPAG